jgi:hypothetical protein
MGRFATALLVVASMLAFGPSPTAQATDINENPECQRMFQRLVQPYWDQLQYFGSTAAQYPMAPNGRPLMTGWPYSGYGPGNSYGPGSPYGPNFGPWGVGSFGPGFGGPGGYGITPDGFGGPVYQGAGAYAALGTAALGAYPGGTGALAVANTLAANTGIGNLAPADLVALGSLRQSLIGNVQGGIGIQQAMIANRIGDATLRQAVVANRFSAYSANSDLASFPYVRMNDLGNAIAAVSTYVQNMCPSPSDRGD